MKIIRKIVDENGPTRLDYANTLVKPALAPPHVLSVRPVIVDFPAVLFRQVEWRIRKNDINTLIRNVRQDIQAIVLKEDAFGGLKHRVYDQTRTDYTCRFPQVHLVWHRKTHIG